MLASEQRDDISCAKNEVEAMVLVNSLAATSQFANILTFKSTLPVAITQRI